MEIKKLLLCAGFSLQSKAYGLPVNSTDAAPFNPERMKKWEEWVFARYRVAAQ